MKILARSGLFKLEASSLRSLTNGEYVYCAWFMEEGGFIRGFGNGSTQALAGREAIANVSEMRSEVQAAACDCLDQLAEADAARVAFCDLPHDLRFELRDTIESAGGDVAGYSGNAVQVAMPRNVAQFKEWMRRAGFFVVQASDHCFPLGSDLAPDSLRHDGNYPGSRGYWRFVRLIYTGPSSVREPSELEAVA